MSQYYQYVGQILQSDEGTARSLHALQISDGLEEFPFGQTATFLAEILK